MKKLILILLLLITGIGFSCRTGRAPKSNDPDIEKSIETYEIKPSVNAHIPKDGSGPVAGYTAETNPDTVMTFGRYGERVFVENGKVVNFIYDGVDPDKSYVMYESWDTGYYLTLVKKDEWVDAKFNKLCQIFIVGNPSLTRVNVPETMRYEQIIWTPRNDGTWELRIGTTERGCKSKSLDELQKMRGKGYENSVPK